MALRFEWDGAKAQANKAKHGVSFDAAEAVFSDMSRVEYIDDDADLEERFKTVGSVAGKEFAVIYTMRGESIRLISAREATRYETFQYWQHRYARIRSTRASSTPRHRGSQSS